MGRAPCCDKASVKKGPWSPEEDERLKSYIEKHGTGGNWIALPHKIGNFFFMYLYVYVGMFMILMYINFDENYMLSV